MRKMFQKDHFKIIKKNLLNIENKFKTCLFNGIAE